MVHVHKEYKHAFLVEPTKLGRLVDTIHERLRDHQNASVHDTFEVFLTGSRREEMTKVDDVLALDNSRKHKITRLAITCSASSLGAARPEHEVQVDLGRPKPSSMGGSTKLVAISVRSDTAAWANRTLSEVEEQVERNWLAYTLPGIALIGLLLAALFLLASQFVPLKLPRSDWFLTSSDLDRVEAMLAQHAVLSDEDLREVSTIQLRNILAARRDARSAQENLMKRTLFWAVPLLIVGACIVILLTTCYPTAVFWWGDEVKRYASTVERRRRSGVSLSPSPW
jgi:hypothetical protein